MYSAGMNSRNILLVSMLQFGASNVSASLINGSFDLPLIGSSRPVPYHVFYPNIAAYNQRDVPGWITTDVNGAIEIWRDGALGVNAFAGSPQWAEINAYSAGTLSQTVTGLAAGTQYGFSFVHRGRGSSTIADVMRATFTDLGANGVVGGGDDNVIYTALFSDTNVAWREYQLNFGIKANSNPILTQFAAVSTGSGNVSIGNFITGIQLNNGIAGSGPQVPESGGLPLVAISFCGLGWAIRRRQLARINRKARTTPHPAGRSIA